ncbi:TPR-like protein [Clathrospora elynae]|uniref:TPR-like protein n=1 Tax=Clathrospora elynae TaxID=706981 RepID=A0A6A5SND4_9PLEO|nr:TPR-like protein [Clathrospora elynae]
MQRFPFAQRYLSSVVETLWLKVKRGVVEGEKGCGLGKGGSSARPVHLHVAQVNNQLFFVKSFTFQPIRLKASCGSTRSRNPLRLTDILIILVKPMHDAAARALLHKKLGDKGDKDGKDDKDNGIAELATALEHMPLALVQAAAYIRKRHLRRDKAACNSILITWQISFNHIRSTRQSAADLLSLKSFFDRKGIHEALLCNQNSRANKGEGRDGGKEEDRDEEWSIRGDNNNGVSAVSVDDGFEDDVLALQDYSFITATNANTFEMHSLVQLATRKWLENEGQLDRWREKFISNLCAELPTGQHENWQKFQALFPHARVALAQRPKNRESLEIWALLLYKAAWYALERGRADEAEQMSVVSMEVRRELFGQEHAQTLSSVDIVGLARTIGGKYEEAESITRQTLARSEKVLGPEHPSTLTSMSNLAGVLARQGKYEEAKSMNRQTLARSEKVLGPEHPSTLTSMSNLAGVLDSQGKYEEAESMNRQTLARSEKVHGFEHPSTLTNMGNLAVVLHSQGKYEEAESMNRQTLARSEKVHGFEHPSTLTNMGNLAVVLHSQGKYEEAESMKRQTLTRKEKVPGPNHPDTLMSVYCLAHLLSKIYRYVSATVLYSTLWPCKCLCPSQYRAHFPMFSTWSYWHYDESLLLYKRACAAYPTVLGEDHPTTRACRARNVSCSDQGLFDLI